MKNKDMKDRDTDQEIYETFLKDSMNEINRKYSLSEEDQQKIVKIGKNQARLTNIMISIAILLLIIPAMTLMTYSYYGFGGRADKLIDVAANTIYVTEPNMSLEEMEIEDDIGFFSMDILFDVYKRIGKEDYKASEYDIHFGLDNPTKVKKNYTLERPLPDTPSPETEVLIHPDAILRFDPKEEWDMLNHLPDGTVAEIYVSFTALMDPDKVRQLIPKEVDLRWLAVDTGLEAKQMNKEEQPITAIGYPAQIDSTTWSPFNGNEQSNEEVFMDILSQLSKNEEIAETVANKNLDIPERLKFINKNGINVYGAVITGPTTELRKLQQMKEIRAMKVGEVKLWNWK